jgi:anthranilate phosphoribosyltransferase
MIKEGIKKTINGFDLSFNESKLIMTEIMSGNTSDAQIGALLTALKIKGETIEEITAFAEVMREYCNRIDPKVDGRLVDTCGTGGGKIKTFNVSTGAAFVTAGAGVAVAKHGNRSVTSKSGSADVLETLGLNLNLKPKIIEKIIQRIGIGFLYAPTFHPAMKHAIVPRREIGIRSIFNILGPLTNPAGANAQLIGVYDQRLTKSLAQVLKNLGSEEAFVVHGLDGLDEISTLGKTAVTWLKNNEVTHLVLEPRDFHAKKARIEDLEVTTPDESAEITFKILNAYYEIEDPKRQIVLANGAIGILLGGKADSIDQGIEIASESIESGSAYKKLRELIKTSKGNLSKLEELEMKYG